MSGRYRLLQSDFNAVKSHGDLQGDRDARHALRLGMDFDDRLTLEDMARHAESVVWQQGVSFMALAVEDRVKLCTTWNDAYRTAYGETYYEGDHS